MKKLAFALFAMAMTAGQVCALDSLACPPAQRWVNVYETVQVQVPVTEYVDVPFQETYTRMVPVQTQVTESRQRWVNETRTVPSTRTIYVDQPYTVNECRNERRPVTRYRQVTRTVRETEARQVARTVYDRVCDPCGKSRKVARTVYETKMVPVKRKICTTEPYTAYERERVMVPVTKTRKVAQQVACTRQVVERRCITEMVPRTVTTMRPVTETRTVMRKQAAYTTRTENRQVVRRVLVPAPAPTPVCTTNACM